MSLEPVMADNDITRERLKKVFRKTSSVKLQEKLTVITLKVLKLMMRAMLTTEAKKVDQTTILKSEVVRIT